MYLLFLSAAGIATTAGGDTGHTAGVFRLRARGGGTLFKVMTVELLLN